MPIRELSCVKCGKTQEILVLNKKTKLPKKCECGGRLEMQLSKSQFTLIGKWFKNGGY